MASAVYRLRTAPVPAQTSVPVPPAGPDKNCGAHSFLHHYSPTLAHALCWLFRCILPIFLSFRCLLQLASPQLIFRLLHLQFTLIVAPATPPTRAPRTDLTPEERESLGKSLFTDYLSSPDLDEAVGTAQELEAPGFMSKLVQVRWGGGWLAAWGGWGGQLWYSC